MTKGQAFYHDLAIKRITEFHLCISGNLPSNPFGTILEIVCALQGLPA